MSRTDRERLYRYAAAIGQASAAADARVPEPAEAQECVYCHRQGTRAYEPVPGAIAAWQCRSVDACRRRSDSIRENRGR